MQQLINYHKLGFKAVLASGLSATIIGLSTSTAFAQQVTNSALTVQSTGTISGTPSTPSTPSTSTSSNNSIPPTLSKIFTNPTNSISPNSISNLEFSSGSSLGTDSEFTNFSSSNINDRRGTQTFEFKSKSKQRGPRSRVIMR